MWHVEAKTEDILRELLAGAPSVPPVLSKVGATTVAWWEGQPGDAVVMAEGGSPEDRTLGEQVITAQLEAVGYKRAQFTFDSMIHEAGWPDIMQKAKRLVQSGNVTLLRNGWNNIVAHVIGDHGEYNSEIGRDDPESRSITTWQCECPWDQYAWQRTRQWKKYEGRPCAHVLAAFWKSQATPLDEGPPEGQGPTPGQKQGEPEQRPAAPPPPGPRSFGPEEADGTSAPMPASAPTGGPPGAPPGGAPPMAPPAPSGALPTPPMDQLAEQMPPVPGATPGGMPANPNVVSVPGAKVPTPFNPLQYPGGTYSKVASLPGHFTMYHVAPSSLRPQIEREGLRANKPEDNEHGVYVWPTVDDAQQYVSQGDDPQDIWECHIPHDDLYDDEVWGMGAGVTPNDVPPEKVSLAEGGFSWPRRTASAEFAAPSIVRLKVEGYGVAEGKSEAHGAGQYQNIPMGTTGEVLYQDPSTGYVEVIFPLSGGNLTPYHVKMFCEPNQLEPTNAAPPGPFIKRR